MPLTSQNPVPNDPIVPENDLVDRYEIKPPKLEVPDLPTVDGRRTDLDGAFPTPYEIHDGLPEGDVGSQQPTYPNYPETGVDAFRYAMRTAELQVKRGEFRRALEALTVFYDSPDLAPIDQQQLTDWLDALAGKVIYSSEHLLELPYVTRQGDTLQAIAAIYRVPPQLLFNINRSQINNPNVLLVGNELKVVRGPFEAHVDVDDEKLTLFLENGKYYAGHFRVNIGNKPFPRVRNKPYRIHRIFSPKDRNNPFRDWWIDLGSEAAIHPVSDTADQSAPESIGLNSVDMADLASILEEDCRVYIRR
ncbi:MAG: LysM peptidoglycan-binding domain-containing protein [Planctomycetes bacterium]|nr:LysM peptidoglycan-binding domain-containing protein [Planctomycetota bacterium]